LAVAVSLFPLPQTGAERIT